ncbi:hypothetical protein HDU93_006391 [Gonapodya sp. JEL0774]|nr:hypothetical protein HDU93_006391 [Gonapodya sp. JEL0774]
MVDAQTQCVSLAQSSVCSPWSAASVNISGTWTSATFDSYMMAWADSPNHIQDFNDAYGCGYGCAERIFLSDRSCSGATVLATLKPICTSTCESYLASVTSVLAACPATGAAYGTGKTVSAGQASLRQATLNYITNFCATSAQASNCQASVPMENGNCGFFDRPASATASCNANGTQPCCALLNGRTFSPAPAASGVSLPLIIGIAAGGAVLIVVVGLTIFLVRRKKLRARSNEYQKQADSGYMGGSDRGLDSKQGIKAANIGNGRGVIPMGSMNGQPGVKPQRGDPALANSGTSAFQNQVRSNGPDWEPVGWQTDRGAGPGGPPMVSATAAAYARGYEQDSRPTESMTNFSRGGDGGAWNTDPEYTTTADERDGLAGGRGDHSSEYHGDKAAMIASDQYQYQKGYNDAPKDGTKRKSSKRKSVIENSGSAPTTERSGSKKHSRKKSDAKGTSSTKQSRRKSAVLDDVDASQKQSRRKSVVLDDVDASGGGGEGRERSGSTRRSSSRQNRRSYYEADDRQMSASEDKDAVYSANELISKTSMSLQPPESFPEVRRPSIIAIAREVTEPLAVPESAVVGTQREMHFGQARRNKKDHIACVVRSDDPGNGVIEFAIRNLAQDGDKVMTSSGEPAHLFHPITPHHQPIPGHGAHRPFRARLDKSVVADTLTRSVARALNALSFRHPGGFVPTPVSGHDASLTLRVEERKALDDVKEHLKQLHAKYHKNITIEATVVRGEATSVILRLVKHHYKEFPITVVAVGHRATTGIFGHLSLSPTLSTTLLEKSPVPVVLVRGEYLDTAHAVTDRGRKMSLMETVFPRGGAPVNTADAA